MIYLKDATNKQRTPKKAYIFVMLLLFFSFFLFSQSIYNKKIKETQIIDINGEEIGFPSEKMINVIILFNPQNGAHLRQLTEIKFILDEFSSKNLDAWAVCKNAKNDALKKVMHLNYHFIIDSQNAIIGCVSDYYCESCLALMFVKDNRIKYWSTSISYDFIREWVKENLGDEN